MCLAIPGEVMEVQGSSYTRSGRLRFGSIIKEANLCLVPEVQVGDFVLVHAGFAIAILDQYAAQKSLAMMEDTSTSGD